MSLEQDYRDRFQGVSQTVTGVSLEFDARTESHYDGLGKFGRFLLFLARYRKRLPQFQRDPGDSHPDTTKVTVVRFLGFALRPTIQTRNEYAPDSPPDELWP